LPQDALPIMLPKRPLSLNDWADYVLTPLGQHPAPVHRHLLAALDRVGSGEIDRLMLLLPPGHAKSTYASVLFPAWWFSRHKASSIITACHTADLAAHFARRVRSLVEEHAATLGYDLVRGDRASARWRTSDRSEYFASGVKGPITGRRADLVLIDDPIKSHAEADSPGARDALWNWYRSDLATRLKPGGRIVLIMTRWHQDDLGGRLIEADPSWNVIRLPAIAETGDPLGRSPGEALWPDWENAAALERKRQSLGRRVWQALYQQDPTPDSNALFLTSRILIIDPIAQSSGSREVRAWDLAATLPGEGRDPDWTVGIKLTRLASGAVVVTDIVRLRAGPAEVADTIVATASQDGQSVSIGLPQDPGQAGKQQVAWLAQRLAGYRVKSSPETGAKLTRATPAAALVEAGLLSLQRAVWNRPFLDEIKEFPNGRKDDQVDALSRAIALLGEAQTQPRRLNVPLLER
jgi:predicted phage terminase large subunit-like protein